MRPAPVAAVLLAAILAPPCAAAREDPRGDDEVNLSKKERYFAAKKRRRNVRARRPRSRVARGAVSLRNMWTHDVLPVDVDPVTEKLVAPSLKSVNRVLRDHFTNQHRPMDPRLIHVMLRAADRFKSRTIEIISGYRSPKYNLMLRKKGHEVARRSQHPMGSAVDFRIPGLATLQLYRFVRSLRVGGVGYYPNSAFVHADTGPLRTWHGR